MPVNAWGCMAGWQTPSRRQTVCQCGSPAVCLLCAPPPPPHPPPRRQEMRLSIGGLEVRPGVWRKAFDEGGYDSDAGEDREAGVALGYVAQVRAGEQPDLAAQRLLIPAWPPGRDV